MDSPLLGKTSLTLAVMLTLLAVPYASPKLAQYRIARAPWEKEATTADVPTAPPTTKTELTQGETALKASTNEKTITNALPDTPSPANAKEEKKGGGSGAVVDAAELAKTKGSIAVEDETGKALDAFYSSLAKTKKKSAGALTRVLHYGDSVITSDYVSGTMRRRMQAEFGDGGHGFLLVANPWEWYFHNDVAHGAGDGWSSSRVTGPTTKDGMYGIGGVTFTGSPGSHAYFGTSDSKSSYGKNVSRFDVYYLETPNGGEVELKSGGQTETFSTKGDDKVSRIKTFTVADGEARMNLRVLSGNPRLFGVALERDVAGVVYDALGANGARAELWGGMSAAHWKEQMELRKPALVILQYGTNESEAPGLGADYEKNLAGVVAKIKESAPNASILIASPLDRAENAAGGMRTKPIIKRLVAAQKNVAKESGVAFWNTFEAMGGEGSMAKWVAKGLGGGDLTHPSPSGAEAIGKLLYEALDTGFEAWLSRHPEAK